MYQVRYDAHTRSIPIRGLNYHLRQWGEPRNYGLQVGVKFGDNK